MPCNRLSTCPVCIPACHPTDSWDRIQPTHNLELDKQIKATFSNAYMMVNNCNPNTEQNTSDYDYHTFTIIKEP